MSQTKKQVKAAAPQPAKKAAPQKKKPVAKKTANSMR